VLAVLLSGHGWRRKSLSPSGALTAFVVGLLMMAGDTRTFGVALIGFYLSGSRATKFGKDRKSRLEEGYHEAGYRNGWQVLSNSATAFMAAFMWNATFAPSSLHASLAKLLGIDLGRTVLRLHEVNISDGTWCPLSNTVANGWSRILIFAALGHFSCCLGDTLASELGILSRVKPRLITTLRPVPPGTNGGVTLIGTLVSILGGGIIGFLVGVTLILENAQCANKWKRILVDTCVWGLIGGGFGSLLDSILGATVQQTRYSTEKKVILQDHTGSTREGDQVISGLALLTNNQVNLVSSVVCAATVGWFGGKSDIAAMTS